MVGRESQTQPSDRFFAILLRRTPLRGFRRDSCGLVDQSNSRRDPVPPLAPGSGTPEAFYPHRLEQILG